MRKIDFFCDAHKMLNDYGAWPKTEFRKIFKQYIMIMSLSMMEHSKALQRAYLPWLDTLHFLLLRNVEQVVRAQLTWVTISKNIKKYICICTVCQVNDMTQLQE